MKTHFAIIFTILSVNLFGQTNDDTIRQRVLEKGLTDSVFVFGKWTESGQTETHLKYLGQVVTSQGQTFKIMTSCWIWGLSYRATNRILIFNNKNEYVGNYYLTTVDDLPDKLENGQLIFDNTDNRDCGKNLVTKINLTEGLPKTFFITCRGNTGDIFTFSP